MAKDSWDKAAIVASCITSFAVLITAFYGLYKANEVITTANNTVNHINISLENLKQENSSLYGYASYLENKTQSKPTLIEGNKLPGDPGFKALLEKPPHRFEKQKP